MKNWIYTLLRKSEKYTKTDMVYLFENGLWSGLRQFGSALTVLISSLVFARFLPEETYGIYKYLISTSTVISSFLLLGLSLGATRYASQGYDRVLRQTFFAMLRYSFLAVGISILLGSYYLLKGNIEIGLGLLACAIFVPLTYAAMNWSGYLTGVKDFKLITILASFASFGTTAAVIVAVFINQNPLVLFLTFLGAGATLNGIAYSITRRKYEKRTSEAPRSELLTYGLHQSIVNALPNIASQADKIFVFQGLGAAELAIYSFAIAIPDQLVGLFANVSRIAFPKFAIQTLENIKENLPRKMIGFIGAAFVVSFIYIPFAPFIYRVLFPLYREAVPYSQFLSLFVFTSLSTIPIAIFQAQNKNIALYTNTLLGSIIQIILNFFLISTYGIWGAVWANAAGKTFNLFVALISLARIKDLKEAS